MDRMEIVMTTAKELFLAHTDVFWKKDNSEKGKPENPKTFLAAFDDVCRRVDAIYNEIKSTPI